MTSCCTPGTCRRCTRPTCEWGWGAALDSGPEASPALPPAETRPCRLTPLSPWPCRYRVVVEGERGNRPHIYCLEQLLQEAVRGRGGRGWGARLSRSPPGTQAVPFPDHRCEAGLHALLAARDQDRSLLESAVPVPLPGHRGSRWDAPLPRHPSRHPSRPVSDVSAWIPWVPEPSSNWLKRKGFSRLV